MGLRVHLLGPIRASTDGEPIRHPPRSKIVSLWAYLLIHLDRPLPRMHVAFKSWPDESERTARANLRRHLHQHRKIQPEASKGRPWLHASETSAQWNPESGFWLDVQGSQQFSAVPSRQADAITLYRGGLLEGVYFDWVFSHRERLRGMQRAKLERMPDSETDTSHLFIVRIWVESARDLRRWRGSVDHISTGERKFFSELDALTAFTHQLQSPTMSGASVGKPMNQEF